MGPKSCAAFMSFLVLYFPTTPDLAMATRALGVPERVPSPSILLTRSIPSITSPKTTCLPSSHGVAIVVMKNWEPFLEGQFFVTSYYNNGAGASKNLRISARISHAQLTRLRMFEYKVFILEFIAINGFSSSALGLYQQFLMNHTFIIHFPVWNLHLEAWIVE